MQEIVIFTANEGRKQNAKQTRADFRRVKRHLPLRGFPKVGGFQEIDEADPADEHAILRQVFKRNFHIVAERTKVPIVVSKKFDVSDGNVIEVSDGIPGVSPRRVLTECVVSNPRVEFGFLNGHAVSGAWNAKTNERAEEARDDAWEDYRYVTTTTLRAHLREGRSVFRTADDNRMGGYRMHKREQVLLRAGVVLITFTPALGGAQFRMVSKGTVNTFSDHPLLWVKGVLY